MVYMGLTGWRVLKTGKRYKGKMLSNAWEQPAPGLAPIIENVEGQLGNNCEITPGPYKLRIISLHQPFASLLFYVKRHETRGWPWPAKMLGEDVGIHAAKRTPDRDLGAGLEETCLRALGTGWRDTITLGAILGSVQPEATGPTATMIPESADDVYAGDWGAGRFATRMGRRMPWARPLPAKGQQGFWSLNTDELDRMMASDIAENWKP